MSVNLYCLLLVSIIEPSAQSFSKMFLILLSSCFRNGDIDKGVNLGMSHIIDAPTLDTIRTPLGGFVNHSDTPNLKKVLDHRKYYLYTIVDIPMGSELTLKYEWYEVEGDDYEYERRDPTVIR